MKFASGMEGRRSARIFVFFLVLAAWIATLANADETGGEMGMFVADGLGEADRKGDYSKHDKVPENMRVERKVVTASWLKCKLACDQDMICQGFKFTPMVGDKLPLCELLTGMGEPKPPKSQKNTAIGNNSTEVEAESEAPRDKKADDIAKQAVTQKYKKAKELVAKAEVTHDRTETFAKDMRTRLLAVQKEVSAGKDEVHAITRKEAAAKKRVVAAHATMKKAKIEVKALEKEAETEGNRKGQEIKAKAKKDARMIEERVEEKAAGIKEKAEQSAKEIEDQAKLNAEDTEGQAGEEIARSEEKAVISVSKKAAVVSREEQDVQEVVSDVSAKETLVKSLCKKNMAVLTLKKKVLQAELELKYKENPEALLKEQGKINKQMATEKSKLKSSEKLGKNYSVKESAEKKRIAADKKKAAKVSEAMQGVDLVNKDELKDLETEAKGFKKDEGALKADHAQLTKYRKKLRELEVKRDKSRKAAEKSFWHEKKTKTSMKEKLEKEKFKAMAGAAESKKMLLMLHKQLSARKNSLEKDVIRLRQTAAMDGESRRELLQEWKKLTIEEVHLKREIKMLEDVKYKTELLHAGYVRRIKEIKASGAAVWLKKHNIQTTIAKFKSDVVSLGTYTDRTTKFAEAEKASAVADNILDMDKRREEVIDDISKQSEQAARGIIEDQLRIDKGELRRIKSPAEMVDVFERLKARKAHLAQEVAALQAKAPSFDDLVAGEFRAVSTYTDRAAVERMTSRLNKQLKRAMNATAVEKQTSILQVSHAAARLYAHQIAHATHEKYVDFKLGRLDKKIATAKNQIRKLSDESALPKSQDVPDNFDHLLNDDEKKKTGVSAEAFDIKTTSWLNPEPVSTPVEVTDAMRSNFRSALKSEFANIAGGAGERDRDVERVVMLDAD